LPGLQELNFDGNSGYLDRPNFHLGFLLAWVMLATDGKPFSESPHRGCSGGTGQLAQRVQD
jgi:hypothetical protein